MPCRFKISSTDPRARAREGCPGWRRQNDFAALGRPKAAAAAIQAPCVLSARRGPVSDPGNPRDEETGVEAGAASSTRRRDPMRVNEKRAERQTKTFPLDDIAQRAATRVTSQTVSLNRTRSSGPDSETNRRIIAREQHARLLKQLPCGGDVVGNRLRGRQAGELLAALQGHHTIRHRLSRDRPDPRDRPESVSAAETPRDCRAAGP